MSRIYFVSASRPNLESPIQHLQSSNNFFIRETLANQLQRNGKPVVQLGII